VRNTLRVKPSVGAQKHVSRVLTVPRGCEETSLGQSPGATRSGWANRGVSVPSYPLPSSSAA
jgi:hypothetical protein